MNSQQHTDPEHHIHGVRGLVVGPSTVHRETRVRSSSHTPNTETFTQPDRAIRTVGLERGYPSVAEAACKRTVEARETLVRLQPEGPGKMEIMNAGDRVELCVEISSRQESGFAHKIGSSGVIVERLGSDPSAFLVELRVPDESLEGDAWYETVEVYEHELKRKP